MKTFNEVCYEYQQFKNSGVKKVFSDFLELRYTEEEIKELELQNTLLSENICGNMQIFSQNGFITRGEILYNVSIDDLVSRFAIIHCKYKKGFYIGTQSKYGFAAIGRMLYDGHTKEIVIKELTTCCSENSSVILEALKESVESDGYILKKENRC